MYKHILLPTDGSPLSARAVASGVALARATGASVTALYVAPPPTPVVFRRRLPIGYATTEHEAAKALGAVEKAAKAAGVTVRLEKVLGDFPADAILATAKRRKCDLIVMASHGRSGLKAVLLGSETQKVLAHATVPVLVHR
jgi:nucleotide-binding universal stress UspA family protein